MWRPIAILLILFSLIPISHCVNLSQPVRIIATGKAQGMPIARGWILTEPSIEGIIVPTRESGSVTSREIIRLMRIYFPRTFDDLVTYDFLLLAQVDMFFISPEQAQWMHDAIADYGLGGVNTRSVMSMNNYLSMPWADSVLSRAFPNKAWAVIRSPYYLKPSGPLIVNDDEMIAPIMRPFKKQIEKTFPGYAGLLTIPKQGSKIHSWLKTNLLDQAYPSPGYIPHLFEWDYERGTTFTMMDMLYDDFWRTDRNSFALDIIVNIIWHGSHRELPLDAMRVHVLRDKLRYHAGEKSAIISIFDFVERFGVNTASLYSGLDELQADKSRADQLYLEGEFDRSSSVIEDVIERLNGLAERAMKLKDQALLWVYLIEWLVVAGTSLLCGTALWVLMIRRRLYREAGVTRDNFTKRRTY